MTINSKRLQIGVAGLLAGALLFLTGTANAQITHSLRISDGKVMIDDRQVPEDELPASLQTEGVDLHYTFVGDARPLLMLHGHYFEFADGTLKEVEPDQSLAGGHGPDLSAPGVQVFGVGDGMRDMSAFVGPRAFEFREQAEELREQAARLGRAFSEEHSQEIEAAARALSIRAQEAASLVESLPRIEVENYLNGIQQTNQKLFDRLVNEREMERETIRLAREIRAMTDDAGQAQRVDQLREDLDEIFELKQQNRRQEIEQLEERLESLQERLEERERMRERIIDKRLKELLQKENEMNW